MKILLVYPNLHGMNMLPSAIGIFTRILRDDGHTVELFDTTNYFIPGEENFNSDKQKERILTVRPFDDSKLKEDLHSENPLGVFREKIKHFAPNLLAFSLTEDLYPVALKLLEEIKEIDIPVILGGVFPTFAPELCLKHPAVNMVCIGEGEGVLRELCQCIDSGHSYTDLVGIWLKTENGIIRNNMRPPEEVDAIPVPDMSLFEESRLYRPMQGRIWRMLPVETHRGCPYQCTYCNSPAQLNLYKRNTGKKYFRGKSIEAVEKELLYYRDELKAEAFYFWADTFMVYNDKDFADFCSMYEKIDLPFWCQARPEEIREERIRKLMSIGLFRMGLGIEHGNEDFRKRVLKRKLSNKLMIDNFKILNKCGLHYSVNNIMGFPTETRKLALDTIKLNRHVAADSANAYSFSPFHGTPLRTLSEELGFCDKNLIARSVTKPTLLNMPDFTPAQIEGLRRCFMLYVKMPIARWAEIEKAEALNDDGNKIWQNLRDECAEKYMDFS